MSQSFYIWNLPLAWIYPDHPLIFLPFIRHFQIEIAWHVINYFLHILCIRFLPDFIPIVLYFVEWWTIFCTYCAWAFLALHLSLIENIALYITHNIIHKVNWLYIYTLVHFVHSVHSIRQILFKICQHAYDTPVIFCFLLEWSCFKDVEIWYISNTVGVVQTFAICILKWLK